MGISLGDPTAGLTAAAAICAALVARQGSGCGQRIDVSLWESTAVMCIEGFLAWALEGEAPQRMGNRDPLMAPHGAFRCAGEDEWVTLACACDEEWRALAAAIEPGLEADSRFAPAALRKEHEDALDERIVAWTRTRDRWDVTRELQAIGIAAFPSLSPKDLVEDVQLGARGFFARLEHPEVGVRTHAGIPWLLSEGPNGVRAVAPLLGADSDRLLPDAS